MSDLFYQNYLPGGMWWQGIWVPPIHAQVDCLLDIAKSSFTFFSFLEKYVIFKICHFYSSRSPVFRAMFQSDMTEAATKVLPENLTWTQSKYDFHVQRVDIQDLQPDTVNDMLLYIYTGNPQVSPVIKFLAITILINNLRTWHTELEIYLQLLTNINWSS